LPPSPAVFLLAADCAVVLLLCSADGKGKEGKDDKKDDKKK
jgi:hypothetical protein